MDCAADDDFSLISHDDPGVVFGASAFGSGLEFKCRNFLPREDPVIPIRPLDQNSLFGVDLQRTGAMGVFRYRVLREFAKRLFCWNCNLASSSDKLCGTGLRWPKCGAGGAGLVWHFSSLGWTAFM